MANASSKKASSANERALQRLLYGMVGSNAVHVILRLFLRPRPIFSFATIIYLLATAASAAIYRFMTAAATNRRDAKGRLKTPENLDGRGVMEYCWDTLYVIWALAIFSPFFGYKLYWLLLVIPGYAFYKVYKIAAPRVAAGLPPLPGMPDPRATAGRGAQQQQQAAADNVAPEELTKTQAKKKAKQEKMEAAQRGGKGARR